MVRRDVGAPASIEPQAAIGQFVRDLGKEGGKPRVSHEGKPGPRQI